MASLLRHAWSALAAVVVLAVPVQATAYEAEVEASTTAQAYQLNGRNGDPVLSRRRLTQTLGLGVYDLNGAAKPEGPRLFVRVRMRLDSDFADSRAAWERSFDEQHYVAPPPPLPVDLMYGYVEGQRYVGGLVGFKVGRQVLVDPLGFYAFDGALVRLTTPAYFALETYGGLEVRAGLPLSTGRWELGGVQRGSRDGLPTNRSTSFQQSFVAPVYGVAVESVGPTWIHGRVTYRKAYNTGEVFVGAPAGPLIPGVGRPLGLGTFGGRRVSSERLGYSLLADVTSFATVRGSIIYDLYAQRVASAEAGTDLTLSDAVIVGLDYSYWRPSFDADSIFNAFNLNPIDDFSARIEINPTEHVSLEGDAMVRRYRADDVDDVTRVATSYAPGGGVRARYVWSSARCTARFQVISGDQGDRYGSDYLCEKSFGRWIFDGRLSLWHFSDKTRLDENGRTRTATSFGYTIGGGYRFTPTTSALLQMEQDANRLVGQRLRLMAVLHVRSWL